MIVAAFVGAFVLALVLAQTTLRAVYGYALTDARFEVRLFDRFTIYAIALGDVTDVERWRFSFARLPEAFVTLSLGNRMFGGVVRIERRRHFPRYLLVTPDDPERTLADLRARIGRTRSAGGGGA